MHHLHRSAASVVILILSALSWARAASSTQARVSGAAMETTSANASHPSALSDEAYEAILQFYEYDEEIPLDSRVVEREETPAYVREKIVFNGIRDSRVPGYLGLPATSAGPFPVILLIDGITGSKSRWWEKDSWPRGSLATTQFVSAGFAVLAIDAQYHGERIAGNDYESPGQMLEREWYSRAREMILQTTVEHRRAIDYLATRPEIDIERVGVLGHSMGGIIIFGLNASEPRVRASVACVTPLNIWEPKEMAVISPFNFARGVGRRPFLMLMGSADPFYSSSEAALLLEMIEGNPKELMFYDSGHRLPERYVGKAHQWFERYLK